MNTRSTIIALVCLAQAGWSQWRADMYLNQAYDSNPFRLPEPEASWVTTADLGLQYDFGGVAVSYQSNYTHSAVFPTATITGIKPLYSGNPEPQTWVSTIPNDTTRMILRFIIIIRPRLISTILLICQALISMLWAMAS